jgi:hypothetical protein
MLVCRPIRRDPEEQEDRIQGGRSRARAVRAGQLRRGRRRGILTENSCEGLMAHDETRAAERGASLLTGRIAERQRQEGSAPPTRPHQPCCASMQLALQSESLLSGPSRPRGLFAIGHIPVATSQIRPKRLAGSGEGSRGDSEGTGLRRCSYGVLQLAPHNHE